MSSTYVPPAVSIRGSSTRLTRLPRMLPIEPPTLTRGRRRHPGSHPSRPEERADTLCLTTTVMAGELTERVREQLNHVSTATLTSQLQRRGIRNTFLSGLRPIKDGQRMLGYAHTLRYVPLREDLQPQLGGGQNAQRRAVE